MSAIEHCRTAPLRWAVTSRPAPIAGTGGRLQRLLQRALSQVPGRRRANLAEAREADLLPVRYFHVA